MPELLSVSTAVPDHCVTASETKAFISALCPPDAAARYLRLVEASGNRTRYGAMPLDALRRLDSVDARSDAYARHAVELGESVARAALRESDVDPASIGAVICVSASGYMMPSLEAHLINRLGLNRACRRIPMTQLGCGGGVAAVGLAGEFLRGAAAETVLIVSVELPSLSLQVGEPSPTDLVAATQFGDGAAAAVLTRQSAGRGPEILGARSVLLPDSVHRDGIRLTSSGFRLAPQRGLPDLTARHLAPIVEDFLLAHGLRMTDVQFWVVHPRTPQIVDAVADSLRLPSAAVEPSRAVWARCGNMISSTVFFVLRELERAAAPTSGAVGVMLALGAGVSCELALIRAAGWLSAERQPFGEVSDARGL